MIFFKKKTIVIGLLSLVAKSHGRPHLADNFFLKKNNLAVSIGEAPEVKDDQGLAALAIGSRFLFTLAMGGRFLSALAWAARSRVPRAQPHLNFF